jgi:hypothetical protein
MKYEYPSETPHFAVLNLPVREHTLLMSKRFRPRPEPTFETIGQLACLNDKDLSEKFSVNRASRNVIKQHLARHGLKTGMWVEEGLEVISKIPEEKLQILYPPTSDLGVPGLKFHLKWNNNWQRLIDFVCDDRETQAPASKLTGVTLYQVEVMLDALGLELGMTESVAKKKIALLRSDPSSTDPWHKISEIRQKHAAVLQKPENPAVREQRLQRTHTLKVGAKARALREDIEKLAPHVCLTSMDQIINQIYNHPSLLAKDRLAKKQD